MAGSYFRRLRKCNTWTKVSDFAYTTYTNDLNRLPRYLKLIDEFYAGKVDNKQEALKNKEKQDKTSKNIDYEPISRFRKSRKQKRSVHKNGFSEDARTNEYNAKKRNIRPQNKKNGSSILTAANPRIADRRFKRPQGFQVPFIDSSLLAYFRAVVPDSIPNFGELPSRSKVRTVDAETFEAFTKDSQILPKDMFYLVFGSVLATFNILGVNTSSPENAWTVKPNKVRHSVNELAKNTNSGFPLYGKKNNRLVKEETVSWVYGYLSNPTMYRITKSFLRGTNLVSQGLSELSTQCVSIMHRFQISPETDLGKNFNVKIRPVWCVPFSVVTIEHMFFEPLIRIFRNKTCVTDNPVYPIGLNNTALSDRVAFTFRRSMRRNIAQQARTFDFSKFDHSIEPYFTSIIFTIWSVYLNLSEKQYAAYEHLRYYTCFTPFVYEDKVMVTRRGLCSGSFTTNLRDTIVNLSLIIMARYLMENKRHTVEEIIADVMYDISSKHENFRESIRYNLFPFTISGCFIYGDDGIIIEDEEFFLVHSYLASVLNMKVTYSKPYQSDESFYFLGRFWDEESRPWHTYSYMIAHIMFRSRWYKKEDVSFDISSKLDLYRVLSICAPLRDGHAFILRTLFNWEPMKNFIEGNESYFLLKEWPNENYLEIPRERTFNLSTY